jgi:hypothetical protein
MTGHHRHRRDGLVGVGLADDPPLAGGLAGLGADQHRGVQFVELSLDSPPGAGATLRAELPLTAAN